MVEHSIETEAALEIIAPDGSREKVAVTQEPFNIGRGGEGDNVLQLDDGRISRRCATLMAEGTGYKLLDRGNRYGVFVNGAKVQQHTLRDGDLITFGLEDSYRIVFHAAAAAAAPSPQSVANLLTRIGSISDFTGTTVTRRTKPAESAAGGNFTAALAAASGRRAGHDAGSCDLRDARRPRLADRA